MHKIKQNGRRWLSGLLALVMTVGLFPTVGLVTTAHAAGGAPPDTIYIEKADYDNKGSFNDPNLPSSNPRYNHSAWMRVFYMDMGDDYPTLPGFCANHDLNITTTPHGKKWVNGESIKTAQGGKYMPAYNIIRYYTAKFMCSAYIEENCGITQSNYKSKYPDAKDLEDARCKWAEENGYGYYAYQSPWTLQLDAGDCPLGRSPAKFFCPKTHRHNRSHRSDRSPSPVSHYIIKTNRFVRSYRFFPKKETLKS